jgi:hypothetical protein
MNRILALASLIVIVTACSTPPAPDTSSPESHASVVTQALPTNPTLPPEKPVGQLLQVASSVPSNNQVGVRRDSLVILGFGVPMSTASVEAAFRAEVNGGIILVRFSWSSDARSVRIQPVSQFPYGAQVDVSISSAARAANGMQLRPFLLHFTVVRLLQAWLPATPALDGHVLFEYHDCFLPCFGYKNVVYARESVIRVGDRAGRDIESMGFLSFDLSNLPANANLVSANLVLHTHTVSGNPDTDLGGLRLVSHTYGTLDGDDRDPSKWNNWCHDPNWSKCALRLETAQGFQAVLVTGMVRFDLDHRAYNGQRSQYRLYYPGVKSMDNQGDYVDITSADSNNTSYGPSLRLTYEAP